MAALCLVTLGFDSSLFWLFPALMVRAALVIPRVDLQAAINLAVTGAYVVAGVLERSIITEERNESVMWRCRRLRQQDPGHSHTGRLSA